MSVHISRSNYTQVSDPHREVVTIPFNQPPTITHTAQRGLSFNITLEFVYQFMTSSSLGLQLSYGQLLATPPELSSDVNITIFPHETGARVMGRISIDKTLSIIIQRDLTPSIAIPIRDALGGVVIAATELRINPSPPLFDQPHYVFSINENSQVLLGPIRLIDPNGGTNLITPVILDNPQGAERLLDIVEDPFTISSPNMIPAYFTYNLVVLHPFDYEQTQALDFVVEAQDFEDTLLSSTATVIINILSVNEFSPVFILTRFT